MLICPGKNSTFRVRIQLIQLKMERNISLVLLCLMSLIVVCHSDASDNSTTVNETSTAAAASSTKSSTTPESTTKSTPSAVKISSTTQSPTTPARITCYKDDCPGNCSTFKASKNCTSDTTNGCKTVITTTTNDTSYLYDCSSSSRCKENSTTTCCFKSNCNTYSAARQKPHKGNASTMFGNLVSITIIMMLVFYF